jgi:hypothetical protein
MIPIPPSCARQIAVRDSVTVSIAALTIGMFRVIFRVSMVAESTSLGRILDSAGTSSKSSNVKASTTWSSNISRASVSGILSSVAEKTFV